MELSDVLRLIDGEVALATRAEARSYLLGAAHDACVSRLHNTVRFSQNDRRWLDVLSRLLMSVGYRSWSYEEGTRGVFVLETCWRQGELLISTDEQAIAYVRGYFDAEGGLPRNPEARAYVQFVQKDFVDLSQTRDFLSALGISCGRLHNPSRAVDPHYWRFYVRTASIKGFTRVISSWHPRKR
jgi:hypothetical protein